MNIIEAIQAEQALLKSSGQELSLGLKDEFVKQGHHLTGAVEDSLEETVTPQAESNDLSVSMASYAGIVNAGTDPTRIPFGGPSTGAKTSKYIQGLKSFWMLKGLSEEEATRAAFATAHKQKIEGMPTVNSYQYSETGQRRWFFLSADRMFDTNVGTLISEGINEIWDNLFNTTESETF